jgi:hypothetical protein
LFTSKLANNFVQDATAGTRFAGVLHPVTPALRLFAKAASKLQLANLLTCLHAHLPAFLCCLQLIELLSVPKGPMLGALTAAVMDWQLAHPKGAKEECIEHIKQLHSSGQLQAAADSRSKGR